MLDGIIYGPSVVNTSDRGQEESRMSQSDDVVNKKVVRLTAIGAAIGGVAGFSLALYDASHSMTMLAAYGMLVTSAMAFMGGLIGANCVGN